MVFVEVAALYLLFTASLLLGAAIDSLPPKELHRRSRSELPGHIAAKRIAKLMDYGYVPRVLIWLAATASAAVLIIWALKTSLILGVLAIVVVISLIGVAQSHSPASWQYRIVSYLAVALVWLLHWLDPIWAKLPSPISKSAHSRLYELDDLADLLKRQANQIDNRIADSSLKTAESALKFASKKVADLAVPLKDVRLVLPSESVGPHLMDELYASGHSAFPVGKKVGHKLPPDLQGAVYLADLVSNSLRGNVSQVMIHELSFIDPQVTLEQALELFLKNHSSILIVNNERDEPTAALWLEDVVSQLVGHKVSAQTDHPADADDRELAESN